MQLPWLRYIAIIFAHLEAPVRSWVLARPPGPGPNPVTLPSGTAGPYFGPRLFAFWGFPPCAQCPRYRIIGMRSECAVNQWGPVSNIFGVPTPALEGNYRKQTSEACRGVVSLQLTPLRPYAVRSLPATNRAQRKMPLAHRGKAALIDAY